MRNASPALNASSRSAHRASWPRVMTSTVLPAMTRSLPRSASTASRYKHSVLSLQNKTVVQTVHFQQNECHSSLVVFEIMIRVFLCPSKSPSLLEGSATRTSPGTPSVSCATPAVRLWQELASLHTRTKFTAWTASRPMWPRSAMDARTQSQVRAA